MILPVLQYPDPLLREVSAPIEEITAEIKELASNMLETMYAREGIGLAAPQVGRQIRLVVIDPAGEDEAPRPMYFINPVLELVGDKINFEEGCLSVPNEYRATVPRNDRIKVTALDLEGKEFSFETDGILAICLQHEVDHLEGKLFIDYLSRLKRNLYDFSLKKSMK